MRYVATLFLFILLAVPATTQAAFGFSEPIFPEICKCESVPVIGAEGQVTSSAPAWGCVLETLQNVINVAISLGFVVATLALMYAGFIWMTSGGNAERRNQGSHLLLNVFVGLGIMLGAWLVVDFLMKQVYDDETRFGPWNNILAPMGNSADVCLLARKPAPIATGEVEVLPGGSGDVLSPVEGTAGCPTCVRLDGFQCKSANSCTIDPAVLSRLNSLKSNFSGTWIVTEAYPPTYNHSNQCHSRGTCIDAAFRGSTGYTADNIRAFAQAASHSGLRAVFETDSCALRNAARNAGVSAYCRNDPGYSHITGNHFSVYSNN